MVAKKTGFFDTVGKIVVIGVIVVVAIIFLIGGLAYFGVISPSSDTQNTRNELNTSDSPDKAVPLTTQTSSSNEDKKTLENINVVNYTECLTQAEILSTKQEFTTLKEISLKCKQLAVEEQNQLDNTKSTITKDELAYYNYRLAKTDANIALWNFYYALATLSEYGQKHNLDTKEEENTYLGYFDEFVKSTDLLMSKLYVVKRDFPQYFNEDWSEKDISEIIESYRQFNHEIGSYYDTLYNDNHAKYFLQVNPESEAIIEQTDRLTKGLGGDDNKIEWAIFNFVRDEVEYKHDPNWQTDWVNSPSSTLFSKIGDCDDHAVLLASMFMRAGISKVQLCFTDNHLFVVADGYNWDATCKSCTETSAPDEDPAKCWEINNYIDNLGKCIDGTKYGECSTINLGRYCNQGNLANDCSTCGCSADYPYCNENTGICYSCPIGTIAGKDNICHTPCGGADTYCEAGSYCRNGKCYYY